MLYNQSWSSFKTTKEYRVFLACKYANLHTPIQRMRRVVSMVGFGRVHPVQVSNRLFTKHLWKDKAYVQVVFILIQGAEAVA